MDCLRSGRDWPPGVFTPEVLAGRGGAAGSPKKSRPRSEELLGVALGGAGSAFGGSLFVGWGPAVLDLGGGTESMPPIRSAWGWGVARGGAELWLADFFTDSLLSIACFSLTRLKGTSSSPSASRVEGSGLGPSIA